jgi:hypothetical protein
MAYSPYYIKAFQTGLEKDKADFQLFPDAFSVLQDAFVWRDRVARKKGYRKIGRLSRVFTAESIGNLAASPNTINVFAVVAPAITETNAEIEVGSVEITIAPAVVLTDQGNGTLTSATPGYSATINYRTSNIIITHTGALTGNAMTINFVYYPALPCMGIHQLELGAINAEQTIAFDPVYVYHWDTADERFEELNPGNTQTFTGTDSDFFWTCNTRTTVDNGGVTTPRSVFLVTNFYQAGDQMYLYDSGAVAANRWQVFSPRINATGANTFLEQALILINYKGRVVALNTWEGINLGGSLHYPNRARWCRNGDFLDTLTMANIDVWRHDIQGNGGYIDAPTSEAIISAEFVRDTLVVGFERSTWKLRYTANEILPFVWERIDSEYGNESTFSTVIMDKGQMSVGQKGITACDGTNVQRIDIKIPDEVFRMHNDNNGNKRVHGIRDYDKELVYWTYPDSNLNRKFPDKVLVFNLENQSWAFFKDSFTVFGVLQKFADQTWSDYDDISWEQAQFAWVDTSLQSLYPTTIAGNQHGYIVEVQRLSRNDPGLAITNITAGTPTQLEIPNHNLSTGNIIEGSFIQVVNVNGGGNTLNGNSYKVNYIDDDNITLSDAITGAPITTVGVYGGGGEVILLHDYRIRTKKFNFLEYGKSIEVGYIDFLVDQTTNGEFSVKMFADHNDTVQINSDDSFFNTIVLTQPYDSDIVGQSKLLHRFFSRIGVQFLQFELNLSPTQKVNNQIHDSDITIYTITTWIDASGRLT